MVGIQYVAKDHDMDGNQLHYISKSFYSLGMLVGRSERGENAEWLLNYLACNYLEYLTSEER